MVSKKRSKRFGGDDDVVVERRGLGSDKPEYARKDKDKENKG